MFKTIKEAELKRWTNVKVIKKPSENLKTFLYFFTNVPL